MARGSFRK